MAQGAILQRAHEPAAEYEGGRPALNLDNKRPLLLLPEKLVISAGLITEALYLWAGAGLRDPFGLFLPRLQSALIWYLTGLALCLPLARLKQIFRQKQPVPLAATLGSFRKVYLAPRRLLFDLRLLHAVSWMFVIFLNLKHLVPLLNPAVYDAQLLLLERNLFGGADPAVLLQRLLTPAAAPLLSDAYMFFYPYMALLILTMLFLGSAEEKELFISRFILLWLLGAAIVLLYPTLGPCFFDPASRAALPYTQVADMQDRLFRYRTYLLAHPTDLSGVYLISGLPSLHMAVALFGTFELAKIFRPAALLSLGFAVLTFVTTVFFAWHYLLDDAAAVPLVAAVYFFIRTRKCHGAAFRNGPARCDL